MIRKKRWLTCQACAALRDLWILLLASLLRAGAVPSSVPCKAFVELGLQVGALMDLPLSLNRNFHLLRGQGEGDNGA